MATSNPTTAMDMQYFEFGWLPELITYLDCSAAQIQPIVTSRDRFQYILNSPRTKEGWFYPPLEPENWAPGPAAEQLVYTDWFALPQTHMLTLETSEEDSRKLAAFVVETFGMLKGMQLVLKGWGHFYRTPIEPGLLGDIKGTIPAAVSRVLERAVEFWRAQPESRETIYGAVHWHLLGPSYGHAFEQFGAAYAVLDTCWAVHSQMGQTVRRVPHSERLPTLCDHYGLHLPDWGVVTNGRSRLSELRNEYFHESKWGGWSIGLGHPQDVPSIHLQLFYFNTRLLLALLGEHTEYTKSFGAHEPRLLE